ncbi:MAG: thermonuclease family protein [Chryseobacterium sp.]|nr:thermonuclease family protein [Candidatus Chryseobacterium enterohippi]
MKFKFLLFLFLPLFVFSQKTFYKVVRIKDGDTVCLLMNGKEEVIRLGHIDTPEKKQAFGTRAKQATSDLCFGKMVSLKGNAKRDRYQRIVAELILPNGANVNRELVKKGMAWHYKAYSNDDSYAKLEATARKNKTGLWKDKKPMEPWKYRKLPKAEREAYNSN